MKLTHYIYISAALAMLTSCGDDEISAPVVDEAHDAIVLRAGVSEGGSGVQTRAGAEDNHAKHVAFTENTQLRLRVDGTWLTHDPVSVTNTTTGKIGDIVANTDNKHKEVSFSSTETLYWDNYGSADPANMTGDGNGRDKGLTIYGVAVDGVATAPEVSSWTALSWNVGIPSGSPEAFIDQSGTNGWTAKDLLASNNVREGSGDGTYKFVNRSDGKLLEFTHVMSKVTVNLIAGDGFPGYTTGAENAKFQHEPEITLLGFNYTGTVNVETKDEPAPTESTTTNIKAWRDNGEAWPDGGQHTSQLTALVFPGNSFDNTVNILRIDVDGNTFFVNATLINAAMTTKYSSTIFKQAYNYIFNIKVTKTDIVVTATIKNWDVVEAAEETPIINVNASYPGTGTGANASFTSFSFYRSLKKTNEYSKDYSGNANSYYAAEGTPTGTLGSSEAWTFSNKLYWPSHETHYFFRGVWPLTSVATDDVVSKPHVKDSGSNQVIDIKNIAYTKDSYPSDLTIGMPNFTDDNKMCDSHANHTPIDQSVNGICATTGTIALNFEYVMSQVEVELRSVTGAAAVHVDENTVVQLVNVYNTGEVKLADRGINTTGDKGTYTLDNVSGDDKKLFRHSAIVPQTLTFTEAGADTNVRFKITVTNTDSTKDVYYADVNPIKKTGSTTEKVAPEGRWESGVHYKYILTLSKTETKVTATLTDWVPVEASDNVWF